MKELKEGNNVLYGYPSPPLMQDIVNLVLTYDKIYDYEEMLQSLGTPAKALAQHFSGGTLASEGVKGWDLSGIFIMIFSICEYHGFDLRKVLDTTLMQKYKWLDQARSTRKVDRERFIRIIDSCFQLVSKNVPVVAEKLISTLSDIHRLFDEGIIIPRESILSEILRARNATTDLVEAATDADMEDEAFLSLVSEIWEKDDPWWTSFTLNGGLLESSYLGIPLHLWYIDLPLVEYKYQRGARYLPKLEREKVIREAFSVLIPEVYTLDVPDLLKIRNSSEFSNLRREIDRVYREVLEAPQDFPDASSLSQYLKNKYFSQLEQLALERRPKPTTVLIRNLISTVHPIVGLIIGGKELYDEYKHKYETWRFAVSTLEMKDKLRTLFKRQQPPKSSLR
jgi:hypothetical protein